MNDERVSCQTCGEKVALPAGYDRAKIRCPMCGYYVPVPTELRGQGAPEVPEPEAEPREDAPPPPTRRKAKKAKPAPMLAGTDDDDGQPYEVPADEAKPCPDCRSRIALDATFCTKCGYNLTTGERTRREEFQPVLREWESRWPLALRLQIFAGCQLINLLAVIVAIAVSGSVIFGFFTFLLQTALQAFVIGSYETIQVKRTSKGTATLTKIWRVGFFKLPPMKIPWKSSARLDVVGLHDVGGAEIITLVYLFFCTACLPALVFWWFAVRPERFAVARCDIYGTTDELIFTTTIRDDAVEIARTIAECTGLIYKGVV